MAWTIAGYAAAVMFAAVAIAALLAGMSAARALNACREAAKTLEAEGAESLRQMSRFASGAAEAAELCRGAARSAARLAEGGRAFGEAAARSAETAAAFMDAWRGRFVRWTQGDADSADEQCDGPPREVSPSEGEGRTG
ncbi:hypothetical protein SAMN05216312_10644 [Cohnella sp. OV330]|uniref:hypothetical protein n=1 Tax=Cohnella sp. OV330 TaxID=1855288 RepID=UPI0008E8BE2E|nr:hypothetical protein [Cohnella sp. OV330]SFB33470.1 hypothetical protein SAMN05216312_10644 [Cohnella sp. OV330]